MNLEDCRSTPHWLVKFMYTAARFRDGYLRSALGAEVNGAHRAAHVLRAKAEAEGTRFNAFRTALTLYLEDTS